MRRRIAGLPLLLCVCVTSLASAISFSEEAAPTAAPSNDEIKLDLAQDMCRPARFDEFFRLFVKSRGIRENCTSNEVSVTSYGQPSYCVSKMAYIDHFPIGIRGWNYIHLDSQSNATAPDYLLVRQGRLSEAVWHIDWIRAAFDPAPSDGRWVGAALETLGAPGRLIFTKAEDGGWRLTASEHPSRDAPFQVGVQRLLCRIRSDDYRREQARVEREIPNDPARLENGQDLAACVKLLDAVEAAIRRDARLAALRRDIDKRLALLAQQQTNAAQIALKEDEIQFRRSLMRDQYLLGDGTTGDWSMVSDLEQRLAGRLEAINRIKPASEDYAGEWINASGTLEIAREGDSYRLEANLVDIDFLAWTCEVAATLHAATDRLVSKADNGETIQATLRDGILAVTHAPSNGHSIDSCGAGGSIQGIFFPVQQTLSPIDR